MVIPFTPNKCWLICHSMAGMANKAQYSTHDSNIMADNSMESDVMIKPATALHHFIPSKPLLLQWLFTFLLVVQ